MDTKSMFAAEMPLDNDTALEMLEEIVTWDLEPGDKLLVSTMIQLLKLEDSAQSLSDFVMGCVEQEYVPEYTLKLLRFAATQVNALAKQVDDAK